MKEFLKASEIIDFDSTLEIMLLSRELASAAQSEVEFVKLAYEYVRDEIAHSADVGGTAVTCLASEVLRERQGICFAKSHLLAAILRCNGVPAGFCYQKLILDDVWFPFLTLHGFNAVYVENKWIRLDARGNKEGVDAQFSLRRERLAFDVRPELGEENFREIYAEPDENVIKALTTHKKIQALWKNLPTELAV